MKSSASEPGLSKLIKSVGVFTFPQSGTGKGGREGETIFLHFVVQSGDTIII